MMLNLLPCRYGIIASSSLLRIAAMQNLQVPGVRYKWKIYSNFPEQARTFEQRLTEMNYKDPEINLNINIGYKVEPPSRKEVLPERIKIQTELRKNRELELASKNRALEVPLDQVYEEWKKSISPSHIKESATYFGIYADLFGDAYFKPVIPIDIAYKQGAEAAEEILVPVYRGNIVKPSEARIKPQVQYSASKTDLFTLVMTTPDCHFSKDNGEYVQWLVGNIPGNKLENGEEIIDYMQPFPPRGAGFCRYVFILYKQDSSIDFSKYKRQIPCTSLAARTFSTYSFYRELQDSITPCSLAFFQADWDKNVTAFYHNVLNMKEPIFEYDFAPRTVPPIQEWYPHKKPFNLYLDKYKEPKELQKELLIEKLKERHPFKPPPRRPKYPLAFKISQDLPSWKRDEIRKKRVGEGKFSSFSLGEKQ